tara:strand:+ start:45948 stop:46184 length:237 start_codon:yes stop_codon:yes gene_type:complete
MQFNLFDWADDTVRLEGRTTCDECGKVIPLTNGASEDMGLQPALVIPKETGKGEQLFHFCDEVCHEKYYVGRMRKEGL